MEITLAAKTLEELAVVTLARTDQWCQDEYLATGIVAANHLYHLLLRIFHHRLARLVAVSLAGTGKEQAQEVIDFGGGAYRGARILVGGLLLDADDGRQACNLVHVGTLHAAQKVAGIGRERLDVTALTLRKDGVEGQRRLARAAQARNNGQRVARYLDVYVLEVVNAGSPDIDLIVTHCFLIVHGLLIVRHCCWSPGYNCVSG